MLALFAKIAAREMAVSTAKNVRAKRRTPRSSARLAESLRYRIGGIGVLGGRVVPQFLRVFRAFRLRV